LTEIPSYLSKNSSHYLRISTTQESTGNDYTPIKTIVTIRAYPTQGEWETQGTPVAEQTFEKEEPLYEVLHSGVNHDVIILASLTQYYPLLGRHIRTVDGVDDFLDVRSLYESVLLV
jgi:hypothetical protein